MRTAPIPRVGDLVAVLTAANTDGVGDPAVEDAMSAAIDDLRSADAFDVTCAAARIMGHLLGEVASVTGESRDDVLRRVALDIATNMPRGNDEFPT